MERSDLLDESFSGLDLSTEERQLLKEVLLALRKIRYGSVVLTVHEGRLVEISRTERLRRGSA